MNRRELITGALATGAGTVLVSNRVSANSPEATDVPRRQQPDQLMGEAAEAGYFSEQQLHEVLGTTQLKRPDSGPTGFGTEYFAPRTFFSFGPNNVLEGDVYLIAGDYKHARQVVCDLHNKLHPNDIFTPIGSVDVPAPNAQLSGSTNVSGWAFDDTAVAKVDVYVDGIIAGTATYGGSRFKARRSLP